MGLLDKVKNMFTEEVEDDEVKVEPVKREVTHVSIESPSSKPKETSNMTRRNTHTVPDDFGDDIFDMSPKEEENVNKPVFFDEKDFKELDLVTKQEEKKTIKKEKEIYGSKLSLEKEVEEKKIFKPTPIISPVYGVLDKNYHKEDIIAREQNNVRPVVSSEPSIDSIRNKAYGTLEDELENTLFGTNSILFKNDEEEKSEEVKPIEEVFPEELEEVKAKEKLERLEELEREEIPKSKFSSSNSNDDILSDLTNDLTRELDELLNMKERVSKQQQKKEIEENFDGYETDDINEDDLLGFIDSTLYKGDDE